MLAAAATMTNVATTLSERNAIKAAAKMGTPSLMTIPDRETLKKLVPPSNDTLDWRSVEQMIGLPNDPTICRSDDHLL